MKESVEFKIEKKFEQDLREHLQRSGLEVLTVQELSVEEVAQFVILAIDWMTRAKFLLEVLKWLKKKKDENEKPKISIPYGDENLTSVEKIEESLKQAGVLK